MSTAGSRLASVTRTDFLNVRRAKLVWAPVALYTLFMLIFFWGQSSQRNPEFYQVLFNLLGVGGVLVIPLIALVAAYLSVAGERESGTITFSLGLPVGRTEFLLGKFLSRSAVVLVGTLVSFAIGTVAAKAFFVPDMAFEWLDYLGFIALTGLYAMGYVAVALAISSLTASRSRAMSGAIGFFFVFNVVWYFLPIGPQQMLEFIGDQIGHDFSQNTLEFVFSIPPTGAYLNAGRLVFPTKFFEDGTGATDIAADPFYLQGWFMLLMLVAWVVVPLALARWRFGKAQLG